MDEKKSLMRMDKLELMTLLQQVTAENDRLRLHCRQLEEANAKLVLSNEEIEQACDKLRQQLRVRQQAEAPAEHALEQLPADLDELFPQGNEMSAPYPAVEKAYGTPADEGLTDESVAAQVARALRRVRAWPEEMPMLQDDADVYAEMPDDTDGMQYFPQAEENASYAMEEDTAYPQGQEMAAFPPVEDEEQYLPQTEVTRTPDARLVASAPPCPVPMPTLAALPVGSFAEAMVQVQQLVERTQAAADEYLDKCRRDAEGSAAEAKRLVEDAQREADRILSEAQEKKTRLESETRDVTARLRGEMERLNQFMAAMSAGQKSGDAV